MQRSALSSRKIYFSRSIKWTKICQACLAKDHFGYYDNLLQHLESDKHQRSIEVEEQSDLQEAIQAFQKFRSRKKISTVTKLTLDKIRIEVTLFLIQNGLPFNLASILMDFIKKLITTYSSEAVLEAELSNTTCCQIAKYCCTKSFKEKYLEDISNRKFGLAFDESHSTGGRPF